MYGKKKVDGKCVITPLGFGFYRSLMYFDGRLGMSGPGLGTLGGMILGLPGMVTGLPRNPFFELPGLPGTLFP